MKKIIFVIIIITLIFTTGCDLFKKDALEDINIVTTIYPIEYITNRLYGKNSTIVSIYPKGSTVSSYKITNKIIKDFSSNDMLIYNGETTEKDYALGMLKENKDLKIIDASFGINPDSKYIDIWLNPSNVLMMASNIKNELENYLTNPYLITEISNQYELLKIDISELETQFKITADNSTDAKIITADESLKFLEKYGFTVINLTQNNKNVDKNIDLAKSLFNSGKKSYIYIMDNKSKPEIVNYFTSNYKVTTQTFRSLEIITEKDLENNEDYLSIMINNISLIQKETYK